MAHLARRTGPNPAPQADRGPARGPEWLVADRPVTYPEALATMDERVAAIRAGGRELVWLVEHPPLYTAGTSAATDELRDPARLPVFATGRGGRYTYHGPGQRIAYVMLDLQRRRTDLRAYVHDLEEWVISALDRFKLRASRRPGHIGVWVTQPRLAKIAALGVRVRGWVTLHGVAVNLDPDLSHYGGIVPCGIADAPITSMAALGCTASMADLDMALEETFAEVFGPDGVGVTRLR